MEILVEQLSDLPAVAEQLIQLAGNRKKWCFYGDLGAGKTTLVKAIGDYLNLQETVTSPTYSLVNEYAYESPDTAELQYLYHLDLYRLNRLEEALDIGIEEYLYNEYYCFIEWAELIESILPEEVFTVRITLTEEGKRRIVCG